MADVVKTWVLLTDVVKTSVLLTDAVKTWVNRNVVLQKDDENAMDSTSEQRSNFRENEK